MAGKHGLEPRNAVLPVGVTLRQIELFNFKKLLETKHFALLSSAQTLLGPGLERKMHDYQ